MKKLLSMVVLIVFIAGALSACSQPQTIEGTERDQIVASAEPLADSIVNNLATGDYAAFSQYFDNAMKDGMTEQSFNDMRTQFSEKLGDYQSRSVTNVQGDKKYNAILYNLKFSKAPNVSMRLVLTQTDPPQISGLWFDSPELRQK